MMKINELLRGGPHRLPFVLIGALLLIAAAHLALLVISSTISFNDRVAILTSSGAFVATCLSILVAKAITRYPGVEASAYLLPGFFIGYGALFTVFLLTRFSYSRLLLMVDFGLTLSWAVGMAAAANRRVLRVGVVPEGGYQNLLGMPLIQCTLLDGPDNQHVGVDAVAADLQHDLSSHWDRFLADCALRGIPVYHTKHLMESLTGKVELQHLSENSFGMLAPVSIFMSVKHLIDWIAALIFIILCFPAFLLLVILIRLDSPGPAIFKQERVGYRGRTFVVYKLRTMMVMPRGSASGLDAAKTQEDDQRITRLGRFLRRTRIDELPQVLNILKGEMSWIGPRPEAKVLSQWYESELPFYRYRHIVRPGITGWAQVSQGHVAEMSDVQNKLYYDFFYIKHYSPWMDIIIAFRTITTIFTGYGAK